MCVILIRFLWYWCHFHYILCFSNYFSGLCKQAFKEVDVGEYHTWINLYCRTGFQRSRSCWCMLNSICQLLGSSKRASNSRLHQNQTNLIRRPTWNTHVKQTSETGEKQMTKVFIQNLNHTCKVANLKYTCKADFKHWWKANDESLHSKFQPHM